MLVNVHLLFNLRVGHFKMQDSITKPFCRMRCSSKVALPHSSFIKMFKLTLQGGSFKVQQFKFCMEIGWKGWVWLG